MRVDLTEARVQVCFKKNCPKNNKIMIILDYFNDNLEINWNEIFFSFFNLNPKWLKIQGLVSKSSC